MSSIIKLHIIFRRNQRYKSVLHFIKNIKIKISKSNSVLEVYLYNMFYDENHDNYSKNMFIKDVSGKKYKIIELDQYFENLHDIKQNIYNNFDTLNCQKMYILDSCIFYNNLIRIDDKKQNTYVKLIKDNHVFTILTGYGDNNLSLDDFTSIYHDKNSNYMIENYVTTIDNEFFLKNYFNNGSRHYHFEIIIWKYILDYNYTIEVEEFNKFFNSETQEDYVNIIPRYLSHLNYLNIVNVNYEMVSNPIFKQNNKSYEIRYYHELDSIISENIIVIDNQFIYNLVNELKINFIEYDIDVKKQILTKLINKSNDVEILNVGKVPEWIKMLDLTILEDLLQSLVISTEINKNNKIYIQDTPVIELISENRFIVKNDSITYLDKVLTYKNYVLKDISNFSLLPIINDSETEDINIITSLNPVIVLTFNNNSNPLFSKFKPLDIYYEKIVPNFVYFFNNLLGIIKCGRNIYRFISMNAKYDLNNVSDLFYFNKKIIGITFNNNQLSILNENNEKSIVDLVSLLTDINLNINIPLRINFMVKDINNIQLSIEGYSNLKKEFNSYTFNDDNDSPTLAKVKYLTKERIVSYNDKLYYLNKFVYLPNTCQTFDKIYDVHFHESVNDELLLNYIINEGYSLGNNFKECKYILIQHQYFENLDSLQLSEIIDNNVIIISLINNEEIEENTFTKTYTSDSNLTKLFLFNIALNDSYIPFIVEQILDKNQFDNRKSFMEIDKQNIFNETNIYSQIIKIINKQDVLSKITVSKNHELFTSIKQKLFNNDNHHSNFINYVISKNYQLNIGMLNEDIKIPENIKKFIFLADYHVYDKSMSELYDLILVNSMSDLVKQKFITGTIIWISDIGKIISSIS